MNDQWMKLICFILSMPNIILKNEVLVWVDGQDYLQIISMSRMQTEINEPLGETDQHLDLTSSLLPSRYPPFPVGSLALFPGLTRGLSSLAYRKKCSPLTFIRFFDIDSFCSYSEVYDNLLNSYLLQ